MGILLQLMTSIVCIQAILSNPVSDDDSSMYDDYRIRLAKKDAFYPFKESLLTTLGFLEHNKGGMQSQRKKAVDSTFIRFGRSSPPQTTSRVFADTPHRIMDDSSKDSSNDSSKDRQQRYVLNHNGCQISNSQELLRALMNDRNCVKAFPKVKREHVHDTFIRFGKRSISSKQGINDEV